MTNHHPFSVLMSLYAKEQPAFLDLCLNSLSKQTLKATEIIIVIDGPITAALQEILDKWQKKIPIKQFPQKQNQGLGVALNLGLKECSYEYVFRMDTDDICKKNRFEEQLTYLLSHTEIDILGCHVEEFDKTPYDLAQVKKAPTANQIRSYIKFRNPINHMGVLYKKSKILQVGGYQDLPYMEDYYLWIRAHSNGLVIDNLQRSLVHARIGNGMLDRRRGDKYNISEKLLSNIKRELLGVSYLEAQLIYLLRITARTTPSILKLIYKTLRI